MAEKGNSSDEEVEDTPGMAQSLGLRMQKKLLGTIKSKSVVKAFVDDNVGRNGGKRGRKVGEGGREREGGG